MPPSRPASSSLSHHKLTGHDHVTRGGKRIYLGVAREESLQKYHMLALGLPEPQAAARRSNMQPAFIAQLQSVHR